MVTSFFDDSRQFNWCCGVGKVAQETMMVIQCGTTIVTSRQTSTKHVVTVMKKTLFFYVFKSDSISLYHVNLCYNLFENVILKM